MKTMKTVCTSYGLVIVILWYQNACGAPSKLLSASAAASAALVGFSIWAMQQKQQSFLPGFRKYIPESIVKELNTPMAELQNQGQGLPAPPLNYDTPIQGAWNQFSRGEHLNQLVVDCRGEPDTCTVYWNCPSCCKTSNNNRAVTELGKVKDDKTSRSKLTDRVYWGDIYDPGRFKKGELELVKARLFYQGDTGNLKVDCYDITTTNQKFAGRFGRKSPATEWTMEVARRSSSPNL